RPDLRPEAALDVVRAVAGGRPRALRRAVHARPQVRRESHGRVGPAPLHGELREVLVRAVDGAPLRPRAARGARPLRRVRLPAAVLRALGDDGRAARVGLLVLSPMSRAREPISSRVLLAPLRAWDRFFFAEMD